MEKEEFVIRKSVAVLAKIVFAVMTLIAGFLVFMLIRILPDNHRPADIYSLCLVLLTSFGFMWYSFNFVKSLPNRSITVDADGLWITTTGKASSLIRWHDIVGAKEGGDENFGNLSLIGRQGKTLLKIANGLDGFKQLRALISERMTFQPPQLPMVFSFKPAPIYGFATMTISSLIIAWMFFLHQALWFGVVFAVFAIFFGLFSWIMTRNRVVIDRDRIISRSRSILFSEITSVSIRDIVIRDYTSSHVQLDLTPNVLGSRSLTLASLNVDSLTLKRTILWAMENSNS